MTDIRKATRQYEQWMRLCTPVVEIHLHRKHRLMKEDPFSFMRGTYYRWAQLFPIVCPELMRAPRVLAVGDLHVDSFGTWRDSEGRLSWGIDDFDESFHLPYINDLVRLCASAKIVNDIGHLNAGFKNSCDLILDGYQVALKNGGQPIVLAEHETNLERLGIKSAQTSGGFLAEIKPPSPGATWQPSPRCEEGARGDVSGSKTEIQSGRPRGWIGQSWSTEIRGHC